MFRRDKDSRLDNEGLRRMREAIRQRIEQEEGGTTEETAEAPPYHPAPQQNQTPEGYTPPPSSYEPLSREPLNREPLKRETEHSYLSPARQERNTAAPTPAPLPAPERTAGADWASASEAPPGPAATTVAHDTAWRGTLRSSGPIRIEGSFEGEIVTEQELYVAADARVEATVRAASIIVMGQLSGQINCRERLEVQPSGRVSGQIDAGRFVVHEGAFLGGQVRMRATDDDQGAAADSRPVLQRVR